METIRELEIPYPQKANEQSFSKSLAQASKAEAEARKEGEIEKAIASLHLKTAQAFTILDAFKPPK